MQESHTFTETGTYTTDRSEISSILSFASKGTAADYTLSVEVQLVSGGNWYEVVSEIEDGKVNTTTSGAAALRATVSSMGTATSITFEANGTLK